MVKTEFKENNDIERGEKMLHIVKEDFDESPEDILNTISKMLNNKNTNKEETENKEKEE